MLRGIFALGAVVSFLGACALATALFAVRFVPPRYVARFVPAPLQVYFQPAHVELPTPSAPHAPSTPRVVAALLTPVPQVTPLASQSVTLPTPVPARNANVTPSATPIVNQPTSTSAPTPRSTLTLTPVSFPGPTQAARSTPAALDSATVLLTGFRHVFQTWNNCGPANLTMALSYYGWKGSQADAAAVLKPDPEDRNVNPDELAAFARSQGLQAVVRVNGTLDLLKALLRAGFPPIVEKGFEPEEKLGWMGHYELVIGWSDAASQFIVMDSYLGPNQPVSFDDMDKYWRQFNWTYIVVYRPDQQEALVKIIGAEMDDATMYRNALARTQAELAANDQDAFGWFNLGSNYAALQMFNESVAAYDQARHIGLPWRMTWYQFGWFEAYLATDRTEDVIALAEATLKSNPYSEEMYLYKGLALQKRGDTSAARGQFELALKHNPNFAPAKKALDALRS
jgi:tetratricopeptide (TPR) repeat protein